MNDKSLDERGGAQLLTPRDAGEAPAGRTAADNTLFRLRTLLAPVDFSNYSAKALDYVRAFAAQFGAEVVLVHVVEPTVIPDNFGIVPPSYEEVGTALVKAAEVRLSRLAEEVSAKSGTVRQVVRTGRAPWEIVRVAEEVEADLIVITTHGYTGLKHVLMGSTAELIVRHAPCPVLTVRDPEHDFVERRPQS
jgi:universal stress protein A